MAKVSARTTTTVVKNADRSQKHSYPARLGELLFVKWPQAGVRDDYRKTAKDQRQQDWQSP